MDDSNLTTIPILCTTHQALLVDQAGYTQEDPWQALLISATTALFQGIAADNTTMAKLDYKISRIGDFGCLACERPDLFGEIVEAAKMKNLMFIRALGTSWVDTQLIPKDEFELDLDILANDIYENNKKVGWWDNPNRCLFECLQLVSTEVAEATEGERKDLMDDHLPSRKMGEVELADALIRILDLGAHLNMKYDRTVMPYEWAYEPDISIGKQHLAINVPILWMSIALHDPDSVEFTAEEAYSTIVSTILFVAYRNEYYIMQAVKDKIEYNAKRADHKRENRVKEGGKKF